jgi:hypothetical protein
MTYRILDLEPERIPHHRSLSGTHPWGPLLGAGGWLVAWTEANVIHSCGGVLERERAMIPASATLSLAAGVTRCSGPEVHDCDLAPIVWARVNVRVGACLCSK